MRKNVFLRLTAGVLLLLSAICLFLCCFLPNGLPSQRMAERWQGHNPLTFVQTSCFFPLGQEPSPEDLLTFRELANKSNLENGLEGDYLLRDSWCGYGELEVEGPRGACTTDVIAIGGSFFDFHPLLLLDGSYITEEDLMKDRVILDEALAWELFGGTDLAGLTVTMQGMPFVIAGVVAHEDDGATKRATHSETMLYIPMELYSQLGTSTISVYELVTPEIVDGYSRDLLSTAFPQAIQQKNTGRFALSHLWTVIRELDRLPMQTEPVALPYWENAARCMEVRCALLMLSAALFGVAGILCLTPTAIAGIRFGTRFLLSKIPRRRKRKGAHLSSGKRT